MVTGNVRLIEPLGEGAMGCVWSAEHLTLKTRVAVKFISSELASDPMVMQRFVSEASTAAQIKSPHVVQTFDQGRMDDGTPYIVMEMLDGETLMERLERAGWLSLEEAAQVMGQVARALHNAHEKGIVHRDIKPENVILESNGGLKVIDLGVAKLRQFAEPQAFETPGTRSYMAPELFAGAPAEESSDIFALGVTIYRMFSGGAYPYGEVEAFAQPRFGRPTPLVKHRPDLPAWLDHCIARAFALDRRDRYADAVEFAFELEHGSLRAVPESIARPALYDRNPVRFWQVVSVILFIALLLALA